MSDVILPRYPNIYKRICAKLDDELLEIDDSFSWDL